MAWSFNPLDYDPSQQPPQFPVGKYPVVAKRVEKQSNNAQTGGMLVFHCEIIDGPHRGLSGVYRLNLWNASAQATEIAQKQLSALCHVTQTWQLVAMPEGVELLNKPFVIEVALQRDPEAAAKGYTQVVGVFDMNGVAPERKAGQGAPQGQAAPAPNFQAAPAAQPQQPAYQPQPTQAAPQAQPVQQPPQNAQPSWSQGQPAAGQPSWQR